MAHPYMRRQASKLARAGRHGDSMLVHMSPDEVMALMSMGEMTINPKTGMPEAFKLGKAIKKVVKSKALGKIAGALSIIPSPIQPFAMAYSAANSLANKRPLAAIPAALGAAGFSPMQGFAGGDFFGGPNVMSSFNNLTGGGGLENIFNDPNVFNPGAGAGTGGDFNSDNFSGLMDGTGGGGALPGYNGESIPGTDFENANFSPADFSGGGDPNVYNDFGANGNAGPLASGDMSASGGPMMPPADPSGIPKEDNPFEAILRKMRANPMTALSGGMAVGSGIYGMYRAQQMRKLAERAWDPAMDLSKNPGMVTGMPGYQFGLDQGRLAIQRRAAAQGGGGNEDIALARYTPEYAQNFYNAEMARRMNMAQGYGGQNIAASGAANNLDSASLGSMGYGVARMGGQPATNKDAQLRMLAKMMSMYRG